MAGDKKFIWSNRKVEVERSNIFLDKRNAEIKRKIVKWRKEKQKHTQAIKRKVKYG